MPERFSTVKREELEKRLADLQEEYKAASAQLSRALNEVDRVRLRRQMEDLEREMRDLEGELSSLGKDTTPVSDQPQSSAFDVSSASAPRSLRVFLCHASQDKPAVRRIYQRLRSEGFDPWFDEESLLPGQNWRQEIPAAVRRSDIVLVCLSKASTTKAGYVQKEILYALDVADEQPEGSIFVIPVRLEECQVPDRLQSWHWVDLYKDRGWERLMLSLRKVAAEVEVELPHSRPSERLLLLVQIIFGSVAGGLIMLSAEAIAGIPGVIGVMSVSVALGTVAMAVPRFGRVRIAAISFFLGAVVILVSLLNPFGVFPWTPRLLRVS